MSKIYTHPDPPIELPQLDLLSLLFDSEYSVSQESTILHLEASNPTNAITKADLRRLAQQVAHGLRHHYGIGANGPNHDIVTVMSYGQVLVPAAFYGVIAAGGVYSAASPSSTVPELARQITTGRSNLLICSTELRDVAVKAAKECNIPQSRVLVLSSSPSFSLLSIDNSINALSESLLPWPRLTDPNVLQSSLIVILWSSGTTGPPKGVMLSHLNLVAETVITSHSGRLWAARQLEIDPNTKFPEYRTLAHLPISHIAGVFGYLIAPMYAGGTVCWMPRYEWHTLLRHMKALKITAFYTVPSVYLRIAKSPDVTDQFAHLVAATTGAAPMDAELQQAANARLGGKNGDAPIGQTWGLSETTGAVTMAPKGFIDESGSVSPILPNVELRLVDDEGRDVDPGEEGELLVRSVLVTRGYFGNEKATKDAFRDGGWFCTGDVAVMKGGLFYIVDRKKELLKYKGQQIAPAELENTLFTHPQIQEAAVVGIPMPDDPSSEVPRAYVVPVPDTAITAQEVMDFVKSRVAPYKQLRGGVVFVSELPKNAVGKFLRRELRERAMAELGVKRRGNRL